MYLLYSARYSHWFECGSDYCWRVCLMQSTHMRSACRAAAERQVKWNHIHELGTGDIPESGVKLPNTCCETERGWQGSLLLVVSTLCCWSKTSANVTAVKSRRPLLVVSLCRGSSALLMFVLVFGWWVGILGPFSFFPGNKLPTSWATAHSTLHSNNCFYANTEAFPACCCSLRAWGWGGGVYLWSVKLWFVINVFIGKIRADLPCWSCCRAVTFVKNKVKMAQWNTELNTDYEGLRAFMSSSLRL